MAFGKKKDEADASAAIETADDDAPLFPDDAAEADVPDADPAPEPAPVEAVAKAPAPASEAAPSTDSLLSAFQTNESGDDDRSVLVEMAGDVELADLLEELNTLAAAIGVARR